MSPQPLSQWSSHHTQGKVLRCRIRPNNSSITQSAFYSDFQSSSLKSLTSAALKIHTDFSVFLSCIAPLRPALYTGILHFLSSSCLFVDAVFMLRKEILLTVYRNISQVMQNRIQRMTLRKRILYFPVNFHAFYALLMSIFTRRRPLLFE
jgi:hypothetical protein